MIKAVLLDLDNTILDFNKAERVALTKALKALDIEPQPQLLERYSVINLSQWKLLELGKLTRAEVKLRRYELLFKEMNIDASPAQAAALYEGFLGQGHYFMEGAPELLDSLRPDYQLYLVTNGSASVQAGRLESAGISSYFKGIYISEKLGFNKPSPQFFERCFADMGHVKREESVIVGDSLTSDIQGGKNAGIGTVWFNPAHAECPSGLKPDYEITHLCQLPKVLKGWR